VDFKMSENMMCSNHKANSKEYLDNYDAVFRKPTAKPTIWHKDKSKYSRKVKHKQGKGSVE